MIRSNISAHVTACQAAKAVVSARNLAQLFERAGLKASARAQRERLAHYEAVVLSCVPRRLR